MRVKARAVIERDGKLVVSRERRRGRDHVLLPGGRVHDGESIADALIREVREETGLDIQSVDVAEGHDHHVAGCVRERVEHCEAVLATFQDETGCVISGRRGGAEDALPALLACDVLDSPRGP